MPLGLALALAAYLHAAPVGEGLPSDFRAEVAVLEGSASRCPSFRRLLAETEDVPRRPGVVPEPFSLRYEELPAQCLVFDLVRARRAAAWDFQLAEARELSRASMDLPMTLVEGELAALQKEMVFALELGGFEKEFSKTLRAKVQAARARDKPPETLPPSELDRLALAMALMLEGPDPFYAAAERLGFWPEKAARLTEVEDLLDGHGADLQGLAPKSGEEYVRLSGRRYPALAARAAKAMLAHGGRRRLKEALGSFELDGAELPERLERWLKRKD